MIGPDDIPYDVPERVLDNSDKLFKGLSLIETFQWSCVILLIYGIFAFLPDIGGPKILLASAVLLGGGQAIHRKINALVLWQWLLLATRYWLERRSHHSVAEPGAAIGVAPTGEHRNTAKTATRRVGGVVTASADSSDA